MDLLYENAAQKTGGAEYVGGSGKKAVSYTHLGLWLSCIGVSASTGMSRFTFGSMSLMDGIPLVPRMIGLFGILSVLKIAEKVGQKDGWDASMVKKAEMDVHKNAKDRVAFPSLSMCKRLLPTWLRASAIGNFLGCMPGAGMTMRCV